MLAGAIEDGASWRLDLDFPILLRLGLTRQFVVMNDLETDETGEDQERPDERAAREKP
jgi:hypothetical protein